MNPVSLMTTPTTKRTILVADPSEHTRYRVARALSKEGHRVTTASDATEARAAAMVFRVDLLVADVDLPGMKNGDLLQQLKQQNGTSGFVAVGLAARASPRAAEAQSVGFSACLFKPLNEAEL